MSVSMGWDGMRCDGMGWDGMGWDGMGLLAGTRRMGMEMVPSLNEFCSLGVHTTSWDQEDQNRDLWHSFQKTFFSSLGQTSLLL